MLTGQSYVIQTEYPGYKFSIEKEKSGEIHILCLPNIYLDVSKFVDDYNIKKRLKSYDMTDNIAITGTLYGEHIIGNPLGIKGVRWAVDLIEFDGKVAGLTAMLMLASELGLELANYNAVGTSRIDTNNAASFYLSKVNAKRYKTAKFLDRDDYGKMPVRVNVFTGSNFDMTKEELQLMADNSTYSTNESNVKGISVKPLRTMPSERFSIHYFKSQKYNNKRDERLAS